MLKRLHQKLGDLWWYSAMLFIACRSGDVIQAFIGLWLVPKYVGSDELGVVMPLQNLTGFFAAPIAVLAAVFAKFLNTYAMRGEYGKIKSFIRDVIGSSCLIFVLCILAARFVLPFFYERLRITDGLLTVLILAAGFITSVSQLFTNALQGLKKFKTMAFINLIGAPIRLLTLLVSMPIRAISGYVLGQATPPATASFISFIRLRRDFRTVVADSSWRRDIPDMLRYAGPIAIWTIGGIVYSTLYTTLFRQRLPEIESAAYYMLSKLAEIGGYLGMSISVVLFPLAAEAHERGHENRTVLNHAVWGSILFSGVLAAVFVFSSDLIFSLVPIWRTYLDYAPLLPPTTLSVGISCAIGAFVTYEMACRRSAPIWLITGMNAVWIALLISLMGCEFFRGILPDELVTAISQLPIARLATLTWCGLGYTILQFILVWSLFTHSQRKRIGHE